MYNIVHISNDFLYQKLYINLVKEFSKQKISQKVYIQCRCQAEMDSIRFNVKNCMFYPSFVYRKWMKVFYGFRIKKITNDFLEKGIIDKETIIFAYFLITDGGVALNIKKIHGNKYIVAVRNTDINHYLKFRPWLKSKARQIILNAEKVIFLSPSYKDNLKNLLNCNEVNVYLDKNSELIPNGVSREWQSIGLNPKSNEHFKFLYFGEYSKNKNVLSILEATKKIRKMGFKCELSLVGEYGDQVQKIIRYASKHKWASSYSKILSVKEMVYKVDQHHIFIMPSTNETFGVAYAETLSRGLPIIYSKGQGIDGYFKAGLVGFPVQAGNVAEIVDSILKIKQDYKQMSINAIEASKTFEWETIVQFYIKLFNKFG